MEKSGTIDAVDHGQDLFELWI